MRVVVRSPVAPHLAGEYVFPVVAQIDYDALTIGNHDVGHPETVDLMVQSFIPGWHGTALCDFQSASEHTESILVLAGKYLTSNTVNASTSATLGAPYRYRHPCL